MSTEVKFPVDFMAPICAMGFTPTAMSNLFTMYAAGRADERQLPPEKPGLPGETGRLLRARLILEEALETIKALGTEVIVDTGGICVRVNQGSAEIILDPASPPQLVDSVDGACDLIYVATGLLCALGVVDGSHLNRVSHANNQKFPGGRPVLDPATGKYLKPPGWQPPDHVGVIEMNHDKNPRETARALWEYAQNPAGKRIVRL